MSSAELRDALYKLSLTQSDLAQLIRYSRGQINLMCRDHSPVPEPIAVIIRMMIEFPEVRDHLFPWKSQAVEEGEQYITSWMREDA